MPVTRLRGALSGRAALSVLPLLWGCLQSDQALPFVVDPDAVASVQVGPSGGQISLSSGFSLKIPAGALASSTQVTANRLISRQFDDSEGTVVPGTPYDVQPAAQALSVPATVSIRVPVTEIPSGDEVALGIALETPSGVTLLSGGTYDVTSGLLTGQISQLGPVAAVLSTDVLAVTSGQPDSLSGGAFGAGAVPVSGVDGGIAPTDVLAYASSCNPDARRCFNSGLLKVWLDDNLRKRLGEDVRILTPVLLADMELTGFDAEGHPTMATGSLRLTGTLRSTVGRSVNSYAIDRDVKTGSGSTATSTSVTVDGSTMTFALTTDGGTLESGKQIEYEVRRIGTGSLLTLRLTDEIELENDVGPPTIGIVTLHVRLRL